MAAGERHTAVGRSYTAGRRQPYLIRKWPGSRWTLPLGPYTLTQLAILVGTIVTLVKTKAVWAHFGPLNLVIAVGLPAVLTYAARRTRIEGRDPVRTLLAGITYLLQPRAGYLRGQACRLPAPITTTGRGFAVTELPDLVAVTALDWQNAHVGLSHALSHEISQPVSRRGAAAPLRPRTVGLADLLAAAAENGGR
jgi:hypothetical protein